MKSVIYNPRTQRVRITNLCTVAEDGTELETSAFYPSHPTPEAESSPSRAGCDQVCFIKQGLSTFVRKLTHRVYGEASTSTTVGYSNEQSRESAFGIFDVKSDKISRYSDELA